MLSDDVTLYGRDDDMDEFGDTGSYGESLEEGYEEEEEEEEEPGGSSVPTGSMPSQPASDIESGGGGRGSGASKHPLVGCLPARRGAH